MRFHGRLGFEERGQQLTKGGDILVAKLAAEVDNAHAPTGPARVTVAV
jgi:predicted GNAT superfamily acetyltransferase